MLNYREMKTLRDFLLNQNNDELAVRVRLLGVKSKSQRKADMVDAIEEVLLSDGLNSVWLRLDSLARFAVAEACYADDLSFREARFLAKYGKLPSFDKRGVKNWPLLILFLYKDFRRGVYVVPEDLAGKLKAFVEAPPEVELKTTKELERENGVYVRETEREALSEVLALMRLAEQGDLKVSEKTAMPSVAGIKKIHECLMVGDFYPPEVASPPNKSKYDQEIGAIKPVGWSRLLQNARYIGKVGAKSKLTPAGVKALSRPAHEVIEVLWSKWLDSDSFDEFNRVDDIKGQKARGHMTSKPSRRDAIVDALLDCPVGEWVEIEQFSKYMQAKGYTFEVSRDLWKLYLCDREYGSFGYSDCGGWEIVQLRYILAFLFEYAATLGIVDIAYEHPKGALDNFSSQWGAEDLEWLSRYDGLRKIRLTPLGAYCLGMVHDFTPTAMETKLLIEVMTNLQIRIVSGEIQPAEKMLLDTWAEPVAVNTWRLEAKRARKAIERGQNSADFIAFLNGGDDQPLPETVVGFLKNAENDGKAIKSQGEAQLFRCRDSKTAEMVAAQKDLKNRCFQLGGDQLVVPAKHVVKFRKVVQSLGLGIV